MRSILPNNVFFDRRLARNNNASYCSNGYIFYARQICDTVHVYGLDAETNPTQNQQYYDRKEVLAASNDVVPDPLLLLMLRALNIERFVNLH